MHYRDWRECYELAIDETMYGYSNGPWPSLEDFLRTFANFYDEFVWESRITSWPVDPPGSRRMALSKAESEWWEEYEDRELDMEVE